MKAPVEPVNKTDTLEDFFCVHVPEQHIKYPITRGGETRDVILRSCGTLEIDKAKALAKKLFAAPVNVKNIRDRDAMIAETFNSYVESNTTELIGIALVSMQLESPSLNNVQIQKAFGGDPSPSGRVKMVNHMFRPAEITGMLDALIEGTAYEDGGRATIESVKN
jgi:hypothetical protein